LCNRGLDSGLLRAYVATTKIMSQRERARSGPTFADPMEQSLKQADTLPQTLIAVAAVSVGALVANIYYAQPIIGAIGEDLGVAPALSGALVGMTQIGYGSGLFLLVSLGDLVENRRLVLIAIAAAAAALASLAFVHSASPFLLAAFVVGFCSSSAQILVPFIAHLAPPARRGRVVGLVMGGLLTGIMLARPLALFVAGAFGWRVIFLGGAGMMLAVGVALARVMPAHQPRPGLHYGQILASMLDILRERAQVRWRAVYQGLMFCAFNLFWTAVPILLTQRFGLSQSAIGLFALAGSGGALAAPIAGHIADRGHNVVATRGAMAVVGVAFVAMLGVHGPLGLIWLALLAVAIDAAVQVNQVVGQHIIFNVSGEIRGRVNAIYMTLVFAGGALGSALGTLIYHSAGWGATALTGGLIGGLALLLNFLARA
jgi:predicted MFS family arabinose efflux permease